MNKRTVQKGIIHTCTRSMMIFVFIMLSILLSGVPALQTVLADTEIEVTIPYNQVWTNQTSNTRVQSSFAYALAPADSSAPSAAESDQYGIYHFTLAETTSGNLTLHFRFSSPGYYYYNVYPEAGNPSTGYVYRMNQSRPAGISYTFMLMVLNGNDGGLRLAAAGPSEIKDFQGEKYASLDMLVDYYEPEPTATPTPVVTPTPTPTATPAPTPTAIPSPAPTAAPTQPTAPVPAPIYIVPGTPATTTPTPTPTEIPTPTPEPTGTPTPEPDKAGETEEAPTPTPTPTPTPEPEEIEEEDVPLAGVPTEDYWALLNLLAMIVTVVTAVVEVVIYFRKGKKNEKKNLAEAVAGTVVETAEEETNKILLRLVTLIPAIVSIILFLLTEDITLRMRWTDKWTIWMIIILIINVALAIIIKTIKKKKKTSASGEGGA